MGDLKVGDQIIVTMVLYINTDSEYSNTAKDIMSSVRKVVQIDKSGAPYPYKIEVGKSTFWVEGVPYSSLVAELL